MRILTLAILLAIFSTSTTATAQTSERCPAGRDDVVPTRCGVLADQADALDRKGAALNECQRDLDTTTGRLNERGRELGACQRRNERLTLEVGQLRSEAVEPWRLPVGLRVAWDLAVVSTSAAAGALLVADDVPDGLRWSGVTLAGVLGIGRMLFEIID